MAIALVESASLPGSIAWGGIANRQFSRAKAFGMYIGTTV
jgi:hypothetical protein